MWNNFEHQIWKKIKEHSLEQKRLLLAVSGGLDSMVLIEVFSSLGLNQNIQVLHFHHGDFENKAYRDEAYKNIEQFCKLKNIDFVFAKSEKYLKSEAEFRTSRKEFLN